MTGTKGFCTATMFLGFYPPILGLPVNIKYSKTMNMCMEKTSRSEAKQVSFLLR